VIHIDARESVPRSIKRDAVFWLQGMMLRGFGRYWNQLIRCECEGQGKDSQHDSGDCQSTCFGKTENCGCQKAERGRDHNRAGTGENWHDQCNRGTTDAGSDQVSCIKSVRFLPTAKQQETDS